MKRNEMVINIAIELMSRLPEWEKEERLKFASEILQCIEIEGMLPPETDNPKATGLNYVALMHSGIKVRINEWEPDETQNIAINS